VSSGLHRMPGLRRAAPRVEDAIGELEQKLAELKRAASESVEVVELDSLLNQSRCDFHAGFRAAVAAIDGKTIDGTRWSHGKVAAALGVTAACVSRWYNDGDKKLAQIPGWVAPAIARCLPRCAWDAFCDAASSWTAQNYRSGTFG
jgi:hypothetical protein